MRRSAVSENSVWRKTEAWQRRDAQSLNFRKVAADLFSTLNIILMIIIINELQV